MKRFLVLLFIVTFNPVVFAGVPSPCHPDTGQDVCDFYSGFDNSGTFQSGTISLSSSTIKSCGGTFRARTIDFRTGLLVLSKGGSVEGELHLNNGASAPRVLVCNGAHITGDVFFADNAPGVIYVDSTSKVTGQVHNGNVIPVA